MVLSQHLENAGAPGDEAERTRVVRLPGTGLTPEMREAIARLDAEKRALTDALERERQAHAACRAELASLKEARAQTLREAREALAAEMRPVLQALLRRVEGAGTAVKAPPAAATAPGTPAASAEGSFNVARLLQIPMQPVAETIIAAPSDGRGDDGEAGWILELIDAASRDAGQRRP